MDDYGCLRSYEQGYGTSGAYGRNSQMPSQHQSPTPYSTAINPFSGGSNAMIRDDSYGQQFNASNIPTVPPPYSLSSSAAMKRHLDLLETSSAVASLAADPPWMTSMSRKYGSYNNRYTASNSGNREHQHDHGIGVNRWSVNNKQQSHNTRLRSASCNPDRLVDYHSAFQNSPSRISSSNRFANSIHNGRSSHISTILPSNYDNRSNYESKVTPNYDSVGARVSGHQSYLTDRGVVGNSSSAGRYSSLSNYSSPYYNTNNKFNVSNAEPSSFNNSSQEHHSTHNKRFIDAVESPDISQHNISSKLSYNKTPNSYSNGNRGTNNNSSINRTSSLQDDLQCYGLEESRSSDIPFNDRYAADAYSATRRPSPMYSRMSVGGDLRRIGHQRPRHQTLPYGVSVNDLDSATRSLRSNDQQAAHLPKRSILRDSSVESNNRMRCKDFSRGDVVRPHSSILRSTGHSKYDEYQMDTVSCYFVTHY